VLHGVVCLEYPHTIATAQTLPRWQGPHVDISLHSQRVRPAADLRP
jgi:hypothetical protein